VATLGADVVAAPTAEAAVRDANVIVTAGPIVADPASPLTPEWLGDGARLLLPIDFDFYVARSTAAGADLFVTDDIAQFETYRTHGHFREWPAPHASVGEALETGAIGARVVACNLGVAALDAAFARAVLDRA
jgi:ornithine cyclodeaminase/alanine dehydrogenase-like protein (mu-crystallin family)